MIATPISFYLPCSDAAFHRLPRRLEDYSNWQLAETELSPFMGRYHWVLQTYLQLREAGADVELVHEVPEVGIVVSHVECLQYGVRPSPKMMIVSMLVDKEIPLPHAALHITHNPVQRLPLLMSQHYIPPWPQIGLIPRNPARAGRFESVGFIGYPENLHPALASGTFADRLATLGLRLVIPAQDAWHDYSEIDVVMALRNFGAEERHLNKPALKLFNAWLAGVPAVMGFETAYRKEGIPGVDYIEATNVNEVLAALQLLRVDPELRASIVAAGRVRMLNLSESRLRALWMNLFNDKILPMYSRWVTDIVFRSSFLIAGAVRERLLWRRPAWFRDSSSP